MKEKKTPKGFERIEIGHDCNGANSWKTWNGIRIESGMTAEVLWRNGVRTKERLEVNHKEYEGYDMGMRLTNYYEQVFIEIKHNESTGEVNIDDLFIKITSKKAKKPT